MGERLAFTFALTGRRCGTYGNPGRCPGLRTCWAFSPRRAARNPRRERPERAASSQPRATPWVPEYKALRPVRAKVWAHLLFITFALTGRRCGTYVNPGRCPGLWTCWAFSPCRAARMSRIAKIRLIRTRRIRAAQQFVNSLNSLLRRLRPTSNSGAAPQPRCKNSINSKPPRAQPTNCGEAPEGTTPPTPTPHVP